MDENISNLTWHDVDELIKKTLHNIYLNTQTYRLFKYDIIIGLMRGGMIPATCISHELNVPLLSLGVRSYNDREKTDSITIYQNIDTSVLKGANVLVVDDLVDTGDVMDFVFNTTLSNAQTTQLHSCVLIKKQHSIFMPHYYQQSVDSNTWIKFPWER